MKETNQQYARTDQSMDGKHVRWGRKNTCAVVDMDKRAQTAARSRYNNTRRNEDASKGITDHVSTGSNLRRMESSASIKSKGIFRPKSTLAVAPLKHHVLIVSTNTL